jgi:signal transduction histidine kinase
MFQNARLKLTAWYLLIIMLVSISFSMVIYTMISTEVDRLAMIQKIRIERRLHDSDFLPPEFRIQIPNPSLPLMDPELITETKHRMLIILVLINSSILILSGGFGYLLAGRTLRPIWEMHEEQNRFISDSSHELRTPLTALKSSLEVGLRDKNLNLKDAKTLIHESIEEVDKLKYLTDGLLQLTKYQKPITGSKFEILSLSQIINEAIKKIDPLAHKKKIKLKMDITDYDINGEKLGLIDMIIIFLDNAIKYSSEDTEILIQTKKSDNNVKILIQDHGIGIDVVDIPHIFDRFYRADSARSKTVEGGYGLGLPIAKNIIDAHNGSITVDSKVNIGSTFTILLPLAHTKIGE